MSLILRTHRLLCLCLEGCRHISHVLSKKGENETQGTTKGARTHERGSCPVHPSPPACLSQILGVVRGFLWVHLASELKVHNSALAVVPKRLIWEGNYEFTAPQISRICSPDSI